MLAVHLEIGSIAKKEQQGVVVDIVYLEVEWDDGNRHQVEMEVAACVASVWIADDSDVLCLDLCYDQRIPFEVLDSGSCDGSENVEKSSEILLKKCWML